MPSLYAINVNDFGFWQKRHLLAQLKTLDAHRRNLVIAQQGLPSVTPFTVQTARTVQSLNHQHVVLDEQFQAKIKREHQLLQSLTALFQGKVPSLSSLLSSYQSNSTYQRSKANLEQKNDAWLSYQQQLANKVAQIQSALQASRIDVFSKVDIKILFKAIRKDTTVDEYSSAGAIEQATLGILNGEISSRHISRELAQKFANLAQLDANSRKNLLSKIIEGIQLILENKDTEQYYLKAQESFAPHEHVELQLRHQWKKCGEFDTALRNETAARYQQQLKQAQHMLTLVNQANTAISAVESEYEEVKSIQNQIEAIKPHAIDQQQVVHLQKQITELQSKRKVTDERTARKSLFEQIRNKQQELTKLLQPQNDSPQLLRQIEYWQLQLSKQNTSTKAEREQCIEIIKKINLLYQQHNTLTQQLHSLGKSAANLEQRMQIKLAECDRQLDIAKSYSTVFLEQSITSGNTQTVVPEEKPATVEQPQTPTFETTVQQVLQSIARILANDPSLLTNGPSSQPTAAQNALSHSYVNLKSSQRTARRHQQFKRIQAATAQHGQARLTLRAR